MCSFASHLNGWAFQQGSNSLEGFLELIRRVCTDHSLAPGKRERFQNTRIADALRDLALILINGVTCEIGNSQSSLAQESSQFKFIATGRHGLRRIVGKAKSLTGQCGCQSGLIAYSKDGVDWIFFAVPQNSLSRSLRVAKAQGNRPIHPGVIQDVTPIRSRDYLNPKLLSCLYKVFRIIPSGGEQEQNSFGRGKI